jgi:hypothetical protein
MIVTACTDNYLPLYKTFVTGLIKNSGYTAPIIVIASELLNLISRDQMVEWYPNTMFHNIDEFQYFNNNKDNARYYSIEAFNIKADKVIFMDVDILNIGDINPLFEIECDIGMCRELRRPCFNAGLIIIGKKYLNEKTYNELMFADYTKAEGYGTDQKIYNNYFENITEIDQKYNTLVTETGKTEIINLHYIHKPYIQRGRDNLDEKMIFLWEKYYKKKLGKKNAKRKIN